MATRSFSRELSFCNMDLGVSVLGIVGVWGLGFGFWGSGFQGFGTWVGLLTVES